MRQRHLIIARLVVSLIGALPSEGRARRVEGGLVDTLLLRLGMEMLNQARLAEERGAA